jgi:CheY-like chemotaxis protein
MEPKSPSLRVLHLEDNLADRELVADSLDTDGLNCEFTYSKIKESFQAALSEARFDVIISDHSLPSFSGLEALAIAKKLQPTTPFIFVSGSISERAAIANLNAGANDLVLKDHLEKLGPAIRRALQYAARNASGPC